MPVREFTDFLAASPSSFHAAEEAAVRLERAGFRRQRVDERIPAGPGGRVMATGGTVIAWWVPEDAGAHSALRIVGAHTDSPGLMVKPDPQFHAESFAQLAVEVYGGPILPSWFDRDLMLAGRLVTADGREHLVRTPAIARVPHLAIHLDRSPEFHPDRQRHLQPIVGFDGQADVYQAIADAAGVDRDACLPPAAFDLITVDAQGPQLIGVNQNLVASGRLDNLTSVWAGLDAFANATPHGFAGPDIRVFAAFDHEEVGSQTPIGAGSALLPRTLGRILGSLGLDEEDRAAVLARSMNVSADAAHSVHPNYPDKHDPTHHPLMGRGPVTKINANQRYASTAPTINRWRRCLAAAGVAGQDFVGNNAVPCGSTIGPISATSTGIATVDVGVPLLSMHSARELCAWQDVDDLARGLERFLVGEV